MFVGRPEGLICTRAETAAAGLLAAMALLRLERRPDRPSRRPPRICLSERGEALSREGDGVAMGAGAGAGAARLVVVAARLRRASDDMEGRIIVCIILVDVEEKICTTKRNETKQQKVYVRESIPEHCKKGHVQ